MSSLTIALAKGRLADSTMKCMRQAGISCSEWDQNNRKLIFPDDSGSLRFLLVKPSDVPTYVEYGVADMGVVGKDTLLEEQCDVFEMLDLGFGACRMAVAGFPEKRQDWQLRSINRVASKYPRLSRSYCRSLGMNVETIKLNGSVELGPIVGLSDVIIDIVESGRTLKENGLEVLDTICDISARLIVNRASLKTKGSLIEPLIEKMAAAVKEQKS
jgi:ATP phosphoribosyltransferase